MIRFFKRYNKSVLGALVALFLASSLVPWGVDVFGGGSRRDGERDYAVRVDDVRVSHDEFRREKRAVEERYRGIFGSAYRQFLGRAGVDLNQQVADALIADVLLSRAAERHGLAVGDAEVARVMTTELFPEGYSAARYAAFLNAQGLTAPAFQARLAAELLRKKFAGILEDVSVPAEAEVAAVVRRDLTASDISYAVFSPDAVAPKVPAPDDKALVEFFEKNATDYQSPAKAAYAYVVLTPESVPDLVTAAPEDVEMFYSDNQNRFRTPEAMKFRMVRVGFPTSEAKEAARGRAEEALRAVKAGEPFDGVARKFSDDVPSRDAGGVVEWLERTDPSRPEEFRKALFRTKTPGTPAILETPDAFYVVVIDGFKPSEQKPLADVRSEIEAELKKRDAPIFLAARAEELLEEWKRSGASLTEFAARKGLTAAATEGLLAEGTDPAGAPAGLTAKVIAEEVRDHLSIETDGAYVLASVTDRQEPALPPLSEVRGKVEEDYRRDKAPAEAARLAEEAVASLKSEQAPDLAAAVRPSGVPVSTLTGVSRASPPTGPPFDDREAREELFSGDPEAGRIGSFSRAGGGRVVFVTTAVKPPSPETVKEKSAEYRERVAREQGQVLAASVLNRLKAEAQTDVDAAVLSDE